MTTAGEGGMVTTNSEQLWESAWAYKDHGKSYDTVYRQKHPPGFRWLHESFGSNWRLAEVQSAVGRVALRKLPAWLQARRRYAHMLTDTFSRVPGLRVTRPPAHVGHAFYKYYAFVVPGELRPGWTRDRIIKAINAEGIPCGSGSCSEIYREKAFPEEWRPAHRLPIARELGETSLMFLVHPTLSEGHIQATAAAVTRVMHIAAAPITVAPAAAIAANVYEAHL